MRSILEDLRRRGADGREDAGDPAISLRSDVVANLTRILSTPRGSMPEFPDLGIRDATQVYAEYPDAVVWMQKEILSTIQRYEPRLTQLRIEHVPSDGIDFRLQFRIHAMAMGDGTQVPMSFVTAFNSDNHVTFQ